MRRSYADAIGALNTLQSNFATIEAIKHDRQRMNKLAIPEVIGWAQKLGYEPADFDRLNLVHIAGTKGKGSTSAFISSILAQYLSSRNHDAPLLRKIGLYTSPHLRFVRERIQINNEPLSEEAFARYFFEVWDRFEGAARAEGLPTGAASKPVYFRFLTLMAFHVYLREGVDTAVVECGIGGEYDSTNIIVHPTVTGITSLGIDHTAILGDSIEDIAWHKGGIMKREVPAYTVPQPSSALDVLHNRAEAISTSLNVVPYHPALQHIRLGLAAEFQRINASLAIAIASSHLHQLGHAPIELETSLPDEFRRGLEEVRWPGRCEIRRERQISWHIDSGHTLESIRVAGSWFASELASVGKRAGQTRILLFNQQTRDANALARALHTTLSTALSDGQPFTHAVFCTNVTFKEAGYRPDLQSMNVDAKAVTDLEVQKGLAETWASLDVSTKVETKRTIEEAVSWCREIGWKSDGEVMVLVTGSAHLAGGFLEVLESPSIDHIAI